MGTKYIERDMVDILLQILQLATEPVKKTHVIYKANINFYQLQKYISLLTDLDVIEEIDTPWKGYRIKEKGRLLLSMLGQLQDNPDLAKVLKR